jgi:hypothetical protein
MPTSNSRVARALGAEPISDARHLLPPIVPPPACAPLPPGPLPGTEFVIDVSPPAGFTVDDIDAAFTPKRADLRFPRVWARAHGNGDWRGSDALTPQARVTDLALTWELPALLTAGAETARDLAAQLAEVRRIAVGCGGDARARETPWNAAARADRLIALKLRFARSVEMRLTATERRFPSREVWRAAYALGLRWGDMEQFHWSNPAGSDIEFTLSAVGQTGGFLPERAEEGEAVAGIALSFELPRNPAPLAAFDHLAVALGYLRGTLGGRPTTPDGVELDHDRLYDDRDALAESVSEMKKAGISPGSPQAARFF